MVSTVTNVCLNDIRIYSIDIDRHRLTVEMIFFYPQKNKWPKCKHKKEIEWLGFKISESRLVSLVGKTLVIKFFPIARNLKKLSSFFGPINQYMKIAQDLGKSFKNGTKHEFIIQGVGRTPKEK